MDVTAHGAAARRIEGDLDRIRWDPFRAHPTGLRSVVCPPSAHHRVGILPRSARIGQVAGVGARRPATSGSEDGPPWRGAVLLAGYVRERTEAPTASSPYSTPSTKTSRSGQSCRSATTVMLNWSAYDSAPTPMVRLDVMGTSGKSSRIGAPAKYRGTGGPGTSATYAFVIR